MNTVSQFRYRCTHKLPHTLSVGENSTKYMASFQQLLPNQNHPQVTFFDNHYLAFILTVERKNR